MTDNPETRNNKKTHKTKAFGLLKVCATAIIILGLVGCSNATPSSTQTTEPQYERANYEVSVAYLDESPDKLPPDILITNYEELKEYVAPYKDIKIGDVHVVQKFNKKFFENHTLAIRTDNTAEGYSENCVLDVKKNENEVIVNVNTYIYSSGLTNHEGYKLEFIFLELDKNVESVTYNVKQIHKTRKNTPEFPDVPVDKPIIYLYPEKEMTVRVTLGNEQALTCTYPKYENNWSVLAKPNGDLIDLKTDRYQYSLYYESMSNYQMTESGFVVKGEDTISFLEEKLTVLGLSEREANEFIIYWLPQLEANKYNYIRFATMEEIEANMPLDIVPEPDSVIRVLMIFKGLEEPIEVTEQTLTTPERAGFTVVEWGGTNLSNKH